MIEYSFLILVIILILTSNQKQKKSKDVSDDCPEGQSRNDENVCEPVTINDDLDKNIVVDVYIENNFDYMLDITFPVNFMDESLDIEIKSNGSIFHLLQDHDTKIYTRFMASFFKGSRRNINEQLSSLNLGQDSLIELRVKYFSKLTYSNVASFQYVTKPVFLQWDIESGNIEIGNISTKDRYSRIQLHLEYKDDAPLVNEKIVIGELVADDRGFASISNNQAMKTLYKDNLLNLAALPIRYILILYILEIDDDSVTKEIILSYCNTGYRVLPDNSSSRCDFVHKQDSKSECTCADLCFEEPPEVYTCELCLCENDEDWCVENQHCYQGPSGPEEPPPAGPQGPQPPQGPTCPQLSLDKFTPYTYIFNYTFQATGPLYPVVVVFRLWETGKSFIYDENFDLNVSSDTGDYEDLSVSLISKWYEFFYLLEQDIEYNMELYYMCTTSSATLTPLHSHTYRHRFQTVESSSIHIDFDESSNSLILTATPSLDRSIDYHIRYEYDSEFIDLANGSGNLLKDSTGSVSSTIDITDFTSLIESVSDWGTFSLIPKDPLNYPILSLEIVLFDAPINHEIVSTTHRRIFYPIYTLNISGISITCNDALFTVFYGVFFSNTFTDYDIIENLFIEGTVTKSDSSVLPFDVSIGDISSVATGGQLVTSRGDWWSMQEIFPLNHSVDLTTLIDIKHTDEVYLSLKTTNFDKTFTYYTGGTYGVNTPALLDRTTVSATIESHLRPTYYTVYIKGVGATDGEEFDGGDIDQTMTNTLTFDLVNAGNLLDGGEYSLHFNTYCESEGEKLFDGSNQKLTFFYYVEQNINPYTSESLNIVTDNTPSPIIRARYSCSSVRGYKIELKRFETGTGYVNFTGYPRYVNVNTGMLDITIDETDTQVTLEDGKNYQYQIILKDNPDSSHSYSSEEILLTEVASTGYFYPQAIEISFVEEEEGRLLIPTIDVDSSSKIQYYFWAKWTEALGEEITDSYSFELIEADGEFVGDYSYEVPTNTMSSMYQGDSDGGFPFDSQQFQFKLRVCDTIIDTNCEEEVSGVFTYFKPLSLVRFVIQSITIYVEFDGSQMLKTAIDISFELNTIDSLWGRIQIMNIDSHGIWGTPSNHTFPNAISGNLLYDYSGINSVVVDPDLFLHNGREIVEFENQQSLVARLEVSPDSSFSSNETRRTGYVPLTVIVSNMEYTITEIEQIVKQQLRIYYTCNSVYDSDDRCGFAISFTPVDEEEPDPEVPVRPVPIIISYLDQPNLKFDLGTDFIDVNFPVDAVDDGFYTVNILKLDTSPYDIQDHEFPLHYLNNFSTVSCSVHSKKLNELILTFDFDRNHHPISILLKPYINANREDVLDVHSSDRNRFDAVYEYDIGENHDIDVASLGDPAGLVYKRGLFTTNSENITYVSTDFRHFSQTPNGYFDIPGELTQGYSHVAVYVFNDYGSNNTCFYRNIFNYEFFDYTTGTVNFTHISNRGISFEWEIEAKTPVLPYFHFRVWSGTGIDYVAGTDTLHGSVTTPPEDQSDLSLTPDYPDFYTSGTGFIVLNVQQHSVRTYIIEMIDSMYSHSVVRDTREVELFPLLILVDQPVFDEQDVATDPDLDNHTPQSIGSPWLYTGPFRRGLADLDPVDPVTYFGVSIDCTTSGFELSAWFNRRELSSSVRVSERVYPPNIVDYEEQISTPGMEQRWFPACPGGGGIEGCRLVSLSHPLCQSNPAICDDICIEVCTFGTTEDYSMANQSLEITQESSFVPESATVIDVYKSQISVDCENSCNTGFNHKSYTIYLLDEHDEIIDVPIQYTLYEDAKLKKASAHNCSLSADAESGIITLSVNGVTTQVLVHLYVSAFNFDSILDSYQSAYILNLNGSTPSTILGDHIYNNGLQCFSDTGEVNVEFLDQFVDKFPSGEEVHVYALIETYYDGEKHFSKLNACVDN
ncbi:MAG: hypothetical protein CMB64_04730, partial [Euryarchaeota archaeon]|nr:hypothetical protein [Euryarchaeota archaeon]